MNVDHYLARQYRLYLETLPNEDWRERYEKHCKETSAIAAHVQGNNQKALQDACVQAGTNFDQYILETWYNRENGVTTLPLGGIPQTVFDTLLKNDAFWKVFTHSLGVAKGDYDGGATQQSYTHVQQWMEEFCREQHANRFPAVINRFFAGCLPGRVTTIVAKAKFNEFLSAIGVSRLPEYREADWMTQNLNLLQSLHRGIGQRTTKNGGALICGIISLFFGGSGIATKYNHRIALLQARGVQPTILECVRVLLVLDMARTPKSPRRRLGRG